MIFFRTKLVYSDVYLQTNTAQATGDRRKYQNDKKASGTEGD